MIGCSASEFTNLRVPLDSAFGITGSRLADSVLAATTLRERIALLGDAVADYFAHTDPVVDRSVARAVSLLRAQPDAQVSTLAAEIGLSERQLRRRFGAAVGYGPKRLGRVFHFQHLLDLVYASRGEDSWSQLAATAGYADQSHMINECVALTGGAPNGITRSYHAVAKAHSAR